MEKQNTPARKKSVFFSNILDAQLCIADVFDNFILKAMEGNSACKRMYTWEIV